MERLATRFLKLFGYKLVKIISSSSKFIPDVLSIRTDSMLAGLYRSKERKVAPKTIIDIGAAQGKWTEKAMQVWQQSNYVLFEPLAEREQELKRLSSQHPNVKIVNAGAGKEKSVIDFFVTNDLDGSGVADNGTNAEHRTISITTVDDEINQLKLPGPYLLKLDTHGYEVAIFEGASNTLKQTELIIVECYGFQIAPGSLLFWEMCQYLDSKGFRLIDMVDIMRREKDQAFWQCDAFFIPKASPIFTRNTYN